MGDKQVSIRTLKTGEKVQHFPDGTQKLVPQNIALEELQGEQEAIDAASAAQTAARLAAVEDKRVRQRSGRVVPSDKSPV